MLRLVVAVALVVSASSAPHTWTRQLDELQTTKLYSNDNVMSKCHCGGDAVHQDNVHPVSSGCIGEYWDSMEHGPESFTKEACFNKCDSEEECMFALHDSQTVADAGTASRYNDRANPHMNNATFRNTFNSAGGVLTHAKCWLYRHVPMSMKPKEGSSNPQTYEWVNNFVSDTSGNYDRYTCYNPRQFGTSAQFCKNNAGSACNAQCSCRIGTAGMLNATASKGVCCGATHRADDDGLDGKSCGTNVTGTYSEDEDLCRGCQYCAIQPGWSGPQTAYAFEGHHNWDCPEGMVKNVDDPSKATACYTADQYRAHVG